MGDPKAEDSEIMRYAREGGYVVFTHDLDFNAILAATSAESPSVNQVRTQDILPESLAGTVVAVLNENMLALANGAIITIDEARARVRVLPLSSK